MDIINTIRELEKIKGTGRERQSLPKALKIPEALANQAKCHLTTIWFIVDLERYFAVSIMRGWSVTNYHSFVLNSLYTSFASLCDAAKSIAIVF